MTTAAARYAPGYAAGYAPEYAAGYATDEERWAAPRGPDKAADGAIRFATGACSLGAILVAATDKGVCAILMGDDPDALARELQDRFPKADLRAADADFEQTVAKVVGLVEAPGTSVDLPLDVRGTAFQQRVWQALRAIPAGATISYAELAARVGLPSGARAVAGACAANPVALAIPCHRVVRNDGALSGYRWGVERKQALLEREGAACAPPARLVDKGGAPTS